MKNGLPDFPFVGRDMEMQKLHQIWQEVCATGNGPRMVTILGEPGYGKTRLIREFYNQIASKSKSDGNSYWPPNLPEGNEKSEINPLFSENDAQASIPWLWWGIRCENSERNTSQDERCALLRSRLHLTQHTGKRDKKLSDIQKVIRPVVAGFELTLDAVGAGLIQPSIRLARSLCDLTKKTTAPSPCEKNKLQIKLDSEQCIQLCQDFINPKSKGLDTIPLLVVVDDAHAADSLTIKCIYRIFHFAYIHNLPLLVLATYWAKDWKSKDSEAPGNLSTTEAWNCFRQIESALPLQPDTERGAIFHQIECESMDCAPILQSLNLGLGEKVDRHCLDFADRNPQLLHELLAFLYDCRAHHSKKWWFKNDAPSLELSESGFEEFKASTHSKDEFLKKRAEEIQHDPHLATLLQLGALQGQKFLGLFTAEIWNSLENLENSPRPDHLELLRSGEDPHHVIRLSEKEGRSARFRHRSYREAFLSIDPSKRQPFLDAISAKTAAWLETLPADVENADFFDFAVNWFREVSKDSKDEIESYELRKDLIKIAYEPL